jgi:addiction module HigA family antidote
MARTPIHPGEHLAEELREIGMSAAELARQIEVPVNRVTAMINGQRGVTADTALRLGPLVWYEPRILAQPAVALRATPRPPGNWRTGQKAAQADRPRHSAGPVPTCRVQGSGREVLRGGMTRDTTIALG